MQKQREAQCFLLIILSFLSGGYTYSPVHFKPTLLTLMRQQQHGGLQDTKVDEKPQQQLISVEKSLQNSTELLQNNSKLKRTFSFPFFSGFGYQILRTVNPIIGMNIPPKIVWVRIRRWARTPAEWIYPLISAQHDLKDDLWRLRKEDEEQEP